MKIAIIKLSAMGDIIHTMAALQFLKKQDKTLQIDWIVEKSFSEILKHNKDIDNIYEIELKAIKKDKKNIFKQISLVRELSKNSYDLVIDAQGLIKSAIVGRLISKNVIGFCKDSIREKVASYFYKTKVSIPYEKNIIERNIEVISTALNIKVTKDEIIQKSPFLYFNENNKIDEYISADKRNILFVIGASWKSKIYPMQKFITVINSLEEHNCIVLWGSEDEREIAQNICQNTKAKLLPKIDLNTLKQLVSKASLVVGNDTGPTHMAWAMNKASITLFGNTPGYRNTYETKINKILESNSKVIPTKLDKNDFSIESIDEKEVVALCEKLLQRN